MYTVRLFDVLEMPKELLSSGSMFSVLLSAAIGFDCSGGFLRILCITLKAGPSELDSSRT